MHAGRWSNGFEKAMKAAGKSLELFRYDAEHAFVTSLLVTRSL